MLRILLIDGEVLLRLSLGDALRHEGHEVTIVADGAEALLTIRGGSTLDLIVCDIDLPKVNGLELLEAGRKERPETPFIVMTAYGLGADGRAAVESGAAELLTKPFEVEMLLQAIARVVTRP